ncbi:Disease resistance protein RPP13 [Forsythia ovata]|uniref:Disease resistance protein RPP13 n=1 Tax=Forsythia ovata TaxID=205694 RepID=A0ABD1WWZ5_9LAMI
MAVGPMKRNLEKMAKRLDYSTPKYSETITSLEAGIRNATYKAEDIIESIRNVYNDSHIVHYFDIRAWTTVSQKYNVQGLLASLLNSMTDLGHKLYEMEIEELKQKLYQKLQCNRYLIVMDDVWETNAWEEVRRLFPDKNNGSRIILTTRLSNVAVYADSSGPIHRMNFRSLEQSLKLLNKEVFGKECCPSELEGIGITIAKQCKGLPLALVVIGGLLNKSEKTRAY